MQCNVLFEISYILTCVTFSRNITSLMSSTVANHILPYTLTDMIWLLSCRNLDKIYILKRDQCIYCLFTNNLYIRMNFVTRVTSIIFEITLLDLVYK